MRLFSRPPRLRQPLLPLALALVITPPVAFAQPGGFASFDGDGDGLVTEQEFATARSSAHGRSGRTGPADARGGKPRQRFQDIDADGDGRLTQGEMDAFHQQRRMGRTRAGMGPWRGPA